MNIDGLDLRIGDCLQTLRAMPDCSVHCVVTSPPYFGLRDYGVDGQIGLEPTPEEFVQALVEVFREVRRVLRNDGTLWLNLGDSYCTTSTYNAPRKSGGEYGRVAGSRQPRAAAPAGIKAKNLIGIPWRVAFALQADGWYLRQDIIWSKSNPMPESVKDRCTRSHEYLFLLSKRPKYFFDHESIKEPAQEWHGRAGTFDRSGNQVADHVLPGQAAAQHRPRPSKKRGEFNGKTEAMADTGRNAFRAVTPTRSKRGVWTVPVRAFKGAHFATFPPDLIEPCILAGCPAGGIVLDPFGGSGTTAGVAIAHGRKAIICELNQEYAALVPTRVQWVLDWHKRRRPANDDRQIDWVAEASA